MLTPAEIIDRLAAIRASQATVAFDVEGQEWMTCCGFATSPTNAFVIDTLGLKGQPHSGAVWKALVEVLEDPLVTKVCWNAGYERGFLQWAHRVTLKGAADAMFLWAERWPELPKRLKYAASILTRLPCWTEGISFREEDEEAHASGPLLWRYNALDNIATYQLYTHPQLALTGVQRDRYALNLRLIEPFNYASQKGIRYDKEALEQLRAEITPQMWEAQAEVDALAGITLPESEALLDYVKANCCAKAAVKKGLVSNLSSAVRHALKPYRASLERVSELLAASDAASLPACVQGEVAALLDMGLNVKSTKQVVSCLNRLGLPPVFKPGKRKANPDSHDEHDTSAPSQSKDQEALLKLFLKTGHPITTAILKCTALRGRLQELNRGVGSDGRIRCSFLGGYGTETGRTISHMWLDGSGGNLTTVPKEPINFRVLYCADPGHEWWKLDLTGADLWTVACRCATLGDPTMLEDLLAGIRIPSLIGLMLEHNYKPGIDRKQIKADCAAYRAQLIKEGRKSMDTTLKKGGHLTNYGGNEKRIQQTVIEDTYAETGVPFDPGIAICRGVRNTYLGRYWGIPRWWSDTGIKIIRTGKLELANGQVREFLSRRPRGGKLDDETLREALAAEPQAMTTWACNLALEKLWFDVENWPSGVVGEGDPTIQCLIFVHDEITGQYPIGQREFLARKLKAAFDNELTIGRITIKIPFDGATGTNWGSCKTPIE